MQNISLLFTIVYLTTANTSFLWHGEYHILLWINKMNIKFYYDLLRIYHGFP